MSSVKIVFLYTRLADYFYQCIRHLVEKENNTQVLIVRYNPDSSAPFVFQEYDDITIIDKNKFDNVFSLKKFIDDYSPSMLYTAGWSDRDYLKIAKHYFGKIPTIVGLDNPWEGTYRQRIGVALFSRKIRNCYSHIWVAGKPQYEFARRLNFSNNKILHNLYCANNEVFEVVFQQKNLSRQNEYPRKLLFVGRYVDYKQPLLLVQAFKQLQKEKATNGWRLELIGAGPLGEVLSKESNENIEVNDFIPPDQLPSKFLDSGAFCLPSKSEHWGVVVHEASAAGLPLVLSSTTYSGSTFLIHGFNGYRFDESSLDSLTEKLKMLFSLSDEELYKQGKRSNRLSKRIQQEDWVGNLLSVLK